MILALLNALPMQTVDDIHKTQERACLFFGGSTIFKIYSRSRRVAVQDRMYNFDFAAFCLFSCSERC